VGPELGKEMALVPDEVPAEVPVEVQEVWGARGNYYTGNNYCTGSNYSMGTQVDSSGK
jgi:hypothetical protein